MATPITNAANRLAARPGCAQAAACATAVLLQLQTVHATSDIWAKLQDVGFDIYNGLLGLVLIVGAIAFILAMLLVIFSSNPQSVEKGKSWGLRIGLGIILVYTAPYIFQTIKNIAGDDSLTMETVIKGE